MDTGNDTGSDDTSSGEKSEDYEIVSASELAGETGGFSCSYSNNANGVISILMVIFSVFIFRKVCEKN